MSDGGCIFLAVVMFLVLPLAFVFWYAADESKKARSGRQRRGARITDLLAQPALASSESEGELFQLLSVSPPVGYFPDLTELGGWFERASPTLKILARKTPPSRLVELYFASFVFPPGEQALALTFLHDLLSDAGTDASRLELFKSVAGLVLANGGSREAQWLYARSLDAVKSHNGSPETKAAALHVGRLSYAHTRPGKRPTVYDEQAIANDIAMQIT